MTLLSKTGEMGVHRVALAAVALVLFSSCSVLPNSSILFASPDTGAVCAPAKEDRTVGIAFDMLTNVSGETVNIFGFTLDEAAKNIRLLAGMARKELDTGYVGSPYKGDTTNSWVPLVLAPGERFVVDVKLSPTGESDGWTNGLWIMGETSSGRRFRVHTCYALVVRQPGTVCDASTQAKSYPEDIPVRLCGRTESL